MAVSSSGPSVGMSGDGSVVSYETQTGIIAEPSVTPSGDGMIVIVYNSDEGRSFLWVRVNGNTEWMGVELL